MNHIAKRRLHILNNHITVNNTKSKLTEQDVKLHNSENDAWVIINKKIYDVTNFLLTEHCGCEVVRMTIGKKKLSIIKVKEFEKEDIKIKNRVFKKEDAF